MPENIPSTELASLPIALTMLIVLGVNVLKVGSTRSGKSVSAIHDVVEDANRRDCSIVVLDPHGSSLAKPVLGHLLACGHEHRMRFDQFSDYEYVLDLRFLKQSKSKNRYEREAENDDSMRLFTSILTRQGDIGSLSSTPLKEEWVMKALRLFLNQRQEQSEDKLIYAFEPEHPEFAKLVAGCTCEEAAAPFLKIADGSVKVSAYGSAQRLFGTVCNSPAFKVRCGGRGHFDLERFMDRNGILLVEGESKGNVSPDAMRAMFGALLNRIIRYVRTRPRPFPRVKVYLDEATNARLVTSFEKEAMAECQKYGLDLIVMVQMLDFPSTEITRGVLSNCLRHEWFFNANPDVIKKAAEDLGGTRDDDYMGQLRKLQVGERFIKERDRVWRDRAVLLPDPFGLPGLTEKKIEQAIVRMHESPDYRNLLELQACESTSQATRIATTPSSPEPRSTPVSQTTFPISSPAELLSIEDWGDSGNGEGGPSGPLAPSA